jgi:hypothetical protein
MVQLRVTAIPEVAIQRMVFAVEIARFGAILKRERPIIAIGLRWLFPNSGLGIRQ